MERVDKLDREGKSTRTLSGLSSGTTIRHDRLRHLTNWTALIEWWNEIKTESSVF